MRKLFMSIIAIVLLLLGAAVSPIAQAVFGENDKPAENITASCRLSSSPAFASLEELRDGMMASCFAISGSSDDGWIEIGFPPDKNAQGIYIKWDRAPGEWQLLCDTGEGFETVRVCGENGFIQEYVPLLQGSSSVRIAAADGKRLGILELEVYGEGRLHESVHIWEPVPTNVDFLIVSTHQDDELLFFGGAIPYYVGEQRIDTAVIYSAYEKPIRLHEACEGLWHCGSRLHPVFAMLPDEYVKSIEKARQYWDEQELTDFFTRYVLQLRPQVVLTQHTDGEYGHGQHLLTVRCVKNAVETAADESAVAARFGAYSAWDTPKLYLHGSPGDATLRLMWDELILESRNGQSALDIARQAFALHRSQNYSGGFVIYYDNGNQHDCTIFTLFRSKLGEDVEKSGFFENIELRAGYIELPPEDTDYITASEAYVRVSDRNIYSFTESSGSTAYIRCCSHYGAAGWYRCDKTGAVFEPAQAFTLVQPEPEPQTESPPVDTATKPEAARNRPDAVDLAVGALFASAAVLLALLFIAKRRKISSSAIHQ